jgi:hypothetical protein
MGKPSQMPKENMQIKGEKRERKCPGLGAIVAVPPNKISRGARCGTNYNGKSDGDMRQVRLQRLIFIQRQNSMFSTE